MGSWGNGTLDNDTAQDFFAIIADLEDTMDDWTDEMGSQILWGGVNEVFDSEESCYQSVLAACETLASALGRPNDDLAEDYIKYTKCCASFVKKEHILKAKELLKEALNDKRAVEGWDKSDVVEWYKNIENLIDRISK